MQFAVFVQSANIFLGSRHLPTNYFVAIIFQVIFSWYILILKQSRLQSSYLIFWRKKWAGLWALIHLVPGCGWAAWTSSRCETCAVPSRGSAGTGLSWSSPLQRCASSRWARRTLWSACDAERQNASRWIFDSCEHRWQNTRLVLTPVEMESVSLHRKRLVTVLIWFLISYTMIPLALTPRTSSPTMGFFSLPTRWNTTPYSGSCWAI